MSGSLTTVVRWTTLHSPLWVLPLATVATAALHHIHWVITITPTPGERVGGKQIDFPNGKETAPTFVTFLNYIFFFYLTLLNILLGTNGTNETYYIPHQRSEIINKNIAR